MVNGLTIPLMVIATYGIPSVVGVGDGLGRGNKLISASIIR